MPQILQHRSAVSHAGAAAPSRWRVGQVVAPLVLALALFGVGFLMFAPSKTGVERLQSLFDNGARQPSLATSLDVGALQRPPLTLEDLLLIERAESMLADGDIIGARRDLAEAAAAGNTHAKFALAETFDPNLLAARGLRVPVADAGTARALYRQALAAGDGRAQRRLEGLQQGE